MAGPKIYTKNRIDEIIQERIAKSRRIQKLKQKDKFDRNTEPISKKTLVYLYEKEKKSASEIGFLLKFSSHKVYYWLKKYKIPRRTISEAVYEKRNPFGDPFVLREPRNIQEATLMGLGIGLYWGEGTKASKNSVRLGNSDPALIKSFLSFLGLFSIDKKKLRFGLQIFNDIDPVKATDFWIKELKIKKIQFQKIVVTPSRGEGTYKKKSIYGVLTVYFNNKKLRNAIVGKLKNFGYAGE